MTTQETLSEALVRADLNQDELDVLVPPSIEELVERNGFFRRYIDVANVGRDRNGHLWVKASTVKLYRDAVPNTRVRVEYKNGVLTVVMNLEMVNSLEQWTLQEFEKALYVKQYYKVLPVNKIEIKKG